MPQQVEALKFVNSHGGRAGVFMAPGTGKTAVAIHYLLKHSPTLVICRCDDFLTWELELQAEGVPSTAIAYIGSSDTDLFKLTKAIRRGSILLVIITYDLAKVAPMRTWIRQIPFQTVIADECHMIKRWQSHRTKAIIQTTRQIHSRIGMSGSPITNSPEDVFSQCLFIDNGKVFGSNYYEFRSQHYLQAGLGWYIRRGAKASIREKLRHIALHIHEDDVLKLPPIRHVVKSAPMMGIQRRRYEQLVDEWEIVFSGMEKSIEIDSVLVLVAKLRQVAAGFLYRDDKTILFPCGKLRLLENLITDDSYLGKKKKIVIWASHTAEIERIGKLLTSIEENHVLFFGSNRQAKRQARLTFLNDPSIRFFVGQVDSGMGMNELVVADTAVYFSNSHKVVSRQQSMRRIRRHGSQRHKVITYWDLISEGTIDRQMLSNVQRSMSVATWILDHLKRGRSLKSILSN